MHHPSRDTPRQSAPLLTTSLFHLAFPSTLGGGDTEEEFEIRLNASFNSMSNNADALLRHMFQDVSLIHIAALIQQAVYDPY